MLSRTLEPEVMDTEAEAIDYDSMDHAEVNLAFVDDFLRAWKTTGSGDVASESELRILDAGTGTAQIPIELCARDLGCHVTAVDLAAEMLKVAANNVSAAGFDDRILLERVDAKRLPHVDDRFDAVISNSIVHHIPDPITVLTEMIRVLRPGGLLFVRDLLRPIDLVALEHLVSTYAGEANRHQQQMFGDSLHAALTVDEVQGLLIALDLPVEWVSQTTDRHWTIAGRR